MIAIKPTELKTNQKAIFDLAYNGEIILVARPAKKNVVVLSEAEFNKREKALKNVEYLAKLDRGTRDIKNNNLIYKSFDELKAMENNL